jgi:hypothetical protein
MNTETIKRASHGKSKSYFIMTRSAAQNNSLSWDARGILAYLLSRPDDWLIKLDDLRRENYGRDRIRKVIKELIAHGYIQPRQKYRDKKGQWRYTPYILHETPLLHPFTDYQSTGSQNTGSQSVLHNTDIQNTETKDSIYQSDSKESFPASKNDVVLLTPAAEQVVPASKENSPIGETNTAEKQSTSYRLVRGSENHIADMDNMVAEMGKPDEPTYQESQTVAQQTTVVNFKDVKAHWNTETQTWDDPDYVYVGRANRHYNIPQSEWHNPYRVEDATPTQSAIDQFRSHLFNLLKDNPDAIERLVLLKGKKLVCWCRPDPCHGDVLLKAIEYYSSEAYKNKVTETDVPNTGSKADANTPQNKNRQHGENVSSGTQVSLHPETQKTPFLSDSGGKSKKRSKSEKTDEKEGNGDKPALDWSAMLKAVNEVLGIYGKQEKFVANMLWGRAKTGEWAACNLPPDNPVTPEELRKFGIWYLSDGVCEGCKMPQTAEQIQKYVLRFRAERRKVTPPANAYDRTKDPAYQIKPEDVMNPDDFERLLKGELA